MLTPRQRVERVLRGGRADVVPFTVYEYKLPQCATERALRNRGLCIVDRRHSVVRSWRPNVKVTEKRFSENGKHLVRVFWETPGGSLTTLSEPAEFTSWTHERMFKSPDDYKAILFLIEDERYEPAYEGFARAERDIGDDAILRAGLGSEPMQQLVSGNMMGMENFCIEWMDHRDEIMKLYEALIRKRREIYPLVAKSPAFHANYGGNVVPEVTGLENFGKYWVPHYNEAAEVMHAHGKLIGSHLDANCRLLSKAVAGTALDYVEAFTPAPDTDMTLAEARKAWPDKVIWINFPSSVHLRPDEEVERFTVEMLNELDSIDGIIFGITEDVPEDRWRGSFTAIMDGLERHARENPGMYDR